MSATDFAAKGSICSAFIDIVPLIEIVRATSKVEMALAVLLGRRKEWEDSFTQKFEVPLDSEVGLPKMIRAFCVMAQCELGVEGVEFVQPTPPQQPPQLAAQELVGRHLPAPQQRGQRQQAGKDPLGLGVQVMYLEQLRLAQGCTPAIFLFAAAWDLMLTSASSLRIHSMAKR